MAKSNNTFTIKFKDGTDVTCNGGAETYSGKKIDIDDELKWFCFQVRSKINDAYKEHTDVAELTFNLKIDNN